MVQLLLLSSAGASLYISRLCERLFSEWCLICDADPPVAWRCSYVDASLYRLLSGFEVFNISGTMPGFK